MASESGDQFTIRIGGNATGPVVVGRDNRVEIRQPQPGAESRSADEHQTPDSTPTNSADGHGTVFTVMNGDMHVHHDSPQTSPEHWQFRSRGCAPFHEPYFSRKWTHCDVDHRGRPLESAL